MSFPTIFKDIKVQENKNNNKNNIQNCQNSVFLQFKELLALNSNN